MPSDLPTTGPRRAVVVLGMHRSGTSAVAGCLHRLGVDFGPRLMPATEDNARGFYEHIDIVNLHDRLLLALGGSWDETRPLPPRWWRDEERVGPYRTELLALLRRDLPAAPLWGIKDPRLCRLLPWWEPVWSATGSQPLYVIVRRRPSEVAASLARREGFSAAKSHLLWLLHVVEAERSTRAAQRVFVDFQDFLSDWQVALEPVRAALGKSWPNPDADPFVDPALSRSSTLGEDAPLPSWIAQADAALQLGLGGREAEARAAFDRLADLVDAARELYGASEAERSADLCQQLEATRRQARWYEVEWQKARRRAALLQTRLTEQSARLDRKNARFIKKDNVPSNLINNRISFVRKIRGVFSNFFKKTSSFLFLSYF